MACTFAAITLPSYSALVTLADFEVDEGKFTSPSDGSGTSQGFVVASSTMVQTTETAHFSTGSQKITIDDDPNVDSSDFPAGTASWRLRHLSGGGTPANNMTLSVTPDGYIGFFAKTTALNLQAAIYIDDGLGPNAGGNGGPNERGHYQDMIGDGEWHLYQWRFQDPDQWDAFAGTGTNGQIDSLTVTVDGLAFRALKDFTDQDAVIYIDNVLYDSEGPLPLIPEPSTAALALAGVAATLRRRRR